MAGPTVLKENYNVSPRRPLRSLALMLAGLVLLASGLVAAVVLLSGFLAPYVPASMEQAMGRHLRQTLEAKALDSPEAERVRRVLAELEPYLSEDDKRLDYLTLVLENETFNAVALPGGSIVVFTGLLDRVRGDEELAFVLAHELGHFHHRDHLRGMGMQLGLQLVMQLFTGDSAGTGLLASSTASLMALHYSRSQEKAADLYALALLRRAGLPLEGAVSFMETTRGMDERSGFDQYFTTHPHSDDRLLYLRREMGRLQPGQGG